MIKFRKFYLSEMATREISVSEFPNPLRGRIKNIFQKKGEMDGSDADDRVKTKFRGWGANQLKPSQSAIYLGKSLGMAVGGVKGGNLGSMVSGDNHILDGHHRWAATLLAEPKAKIFGTEVQLGIGDLVPVLRSLGDAFGNKRRGEPAGGDVNIYKATIKDALDAIYQGKNMNPKFYDKNKAVAWLESIGGEPELERRLKFIQSKKPPSGAPPRNQMPVIDADSAEDKLAATLLQRGSLDVRPPYAKIKEEVQLAKRKFIKVPTNLLGRNNDITKQIFGIINKTYKNIGGYPDFKKSTDLPDNHTDWYAADMDKDPDADITTFGKAKAGNFKLTGAASDGSEPAKAFLVNKLGKLMNTSGNYAEASDALAHVLITRKKVPFVGDEESIQKLLPGKSFRFVGEHPNGKYPGYNGWYERDIAGKKHLKIILGNPKGVKVQRA